MQISLPAFSRAFSSAIFEFLLFCSSEQLARLDTIWVNCCILCSEPFNNIRDTLNYMHIYIQLRNYFSSSFLYSGVIAPVSFSLFVLPEKLPRSHDPKGHVLKGLVRVGLPSSCYMCASTRVPTWVIQAWLRFPRRSRALSGASLLHSKSVVIICQYSDNLHISLWPGALWSL